jgi:hypothetical protein
MALTWLGLVPKKSIELEKPANGALLNGADASQKPAIYLITGGAEITATLPGGGPMVHVEPGAKLALCGPGTPQKHYFCDWLLGFLEIPNSTITVGVGDRVLSTAAQRLSQSALIGRSPMLFGATLQDALLYRTSGVRKPELLYFVERLFGPSLKRRANPANPFVDADGAPISTHSLTSREHLEVAQINLILMKTPLVVFDLSSDLMREAMEQGFRPSEELLDSGKTVLFILPPGKDVSWAQAVIGRPLTGSVQFS